MTEPPVSPDPGTTRLVTATDMDAVFALRRLVFVVEQQVPEDLERDGLDAVSDHAVHVLEGRTVATGRLLPDGTIGRMAVAPDHRGRGLGAAVLVRLEERARERGLSRVELHAQAHALGFYERSGWVAFGEPYDEAGIAHVSMRKDLH